MKEVEVIRNTQKPIIKEDLIETYIKVGIKPNDTVLVHTSLSKLGFVIGGAQAVVESLIETLNQGTIVMPAHSGDLSDPKDWENPPVPKTWFRSLYENMPAFNPDLTPSRGMGKVSNCLLSNPKRKRSNHPQGSFTALGVNDHYITANHELTPMFGMTSPLGKIYDLKGKILLLGVSYNRCTAFHLSEVMSGKVQKTLQGSPILIDGKRTWHNYEDYDYDSDDFEIIGKKLEAEGLVKFANIGLAKVILLDFEISVNRAKEIIKEIR